MMIINFSDTSKQSLTKGFIKGLSAPALLFGHFDVPPLREMPQIVAPRLSASEALTKDWQAIGNDLNNVVVNYGKKARTPSAG